MAEELKITMSAWPDRVTNANAVFTHVAGSNAIHKPKGWLMSYQEACDLQIDGVIPVQTNVAGSPNAKLRIQWITASTDTTSTVRFIVGLFDAQPDTTSLDPSSFDDSVNADDVSNGAYVLNEIDATISTTSIVSGRDIRGRIRRDAVGEATDTLAADVYIVGIFLVADKTT